MEDRLPLFKRIDSLIFRQLDEFRRKPEYAKVVEFYGGLEDEAQKALKWVILVSTFALPALVLLFVYAQNWQIASEVEARTALVERMQQIITQNSEVGGLSQQIAAPMALGSESDLTGRLSGVLSTSGIDLSKLQVSNFTTEPISPLLTRSEADFKFDGLSTDQLMALFTGLIQRERFRISAVRITRNDGTNLLDGTFRAVHFGEVQPQDDE